MSELRDIDPEGDLTVVFNRGDDKQTCVKVSKATMRFASPIWRAKLSDTAAGKVTELEFEVCDIAPFMYKLLLIAHLQNARLPQTMDLAILAIMARLCDKHKCIAMAADRFYVWMQPHVTAKIKEASAAECIIKIGWLFKWEAMFSAGVEVVLDGGAPSKIATSDFFPSACKDYLLQCYAERFDPVLDKVYAIMTTIKAHQASCVPNVAHAAASGKCELLRIGMMHNFFSRCALLDSRPDVTQVTVSLAVMRRWALAIHNQGVHALGGDLGHKNCMEKFQNATVRLIDSITRRSGVVIDESLEAHFRGTREEDAVGEAVRVEKNMQKRSVEDAAEDQEPKKIKLKARNEDDEVEVEQVLVVKKESTS